MTLALSRRGLLLGAIAAPAIVRARSLMAIKSAPAWTLAAPGPAGAILAHNGSKWLWVDLSSAARYVRLDLTPVGVVAMTVPAVRYEVADRLTVTETE